MLSENAMEKMAEILVNRTEELNAVILQEIGGAIKQIGSVKPSKAHQLGQMLKYGGSYKKIIKKLAEITNLNVKDIEKIMEIVAKENLAFAEQFYKYRNMDFIPYEQNKTLQRQVEVITKKMTDDYLQLSKHFAFKTLGPNGQLATTSLSKVYQTVIDNAILNISKGQETYASEMRKVMRVIADNGIRVTDKGIKTVDYPSGYTRRLDSTVRMNILDGMRDFSNELQKQFGKEFGADGVEISVHANPAEDHANIQGKQFSLEEFEQLNGKEINGEYVGGELERPISTMNCYHYVFSIILGVNKPQYSESELKHINAKNEIGFNFEGKKYTMYQGTQLQRQIETKIRTLKDRQILARASGETGKPMVIECQTKIRQLTEKYNELSKVSGLPPKANRLSVSGYRYIRYKEPEVISTPTPKVNIPKKKIKSYTLDEWDDRLSSQYVFMSGKNDFNKLDHTLMNENFMQLEHLTKKYDSIVKFKDNKYKPRSKSNNGLIVYVDNKQKAIANTDGYELRYSKNFFNDYDKYVKNQEKMANSNFKMKVKPENYSVYTTTHEFGHLLQARLCENYNIGKSKHIYWQDFDKMAMNEIYTLATKATKLSRTELKNQYLSRYGKSKRNYEAWAEIFTKMELGESNPLTEAMEKYIKRWM